MNRKIVLNKNENLKVIHPKPCSRVSEYVQDILVIEKSGLTNPFILPLFANGKPTLLFHSAKGQIKCLSNYMTLFGQSVFPETLTLNDDFILIAYFFKPHALTALYGITATELTDKPIDLHLHTPSITLSLQEQLLNASSTNEMISLLDNYIYRLITKIKADTRILKYATEKISGNPNNDVLITAQNELCLTERTFQRLFENHIGVSPNQYRRISQFNAAFQQLQKRQFKQLSDIAYTHHYADQSHYIRAFKEFTNLTPKQYLAFGTAD